MKDYTFHLIYSARGGADIRSAVKDSALETIFYIINVNDFKGSISYEAANTLEEVCKVLESRGWEKAVASQRLKGGSEIRYHIVALIPLTKEETKKISKRKH